LTEFFGSEAGLSASTSQRLTREWGEQLAAFQQRDLSQADYVYLWADGIHFNIRLEHEWLCCLGLVSVTSTENRGLPYHDGLDYRLRVGLVMQQGSEVRT
jgi:hypothetical protein